MLALFGFFVFCFVLAEGVGELFWVFLGLFFAQTWATDLFYTRGNSLRP